MRRPLALLAPFLLAAPASAEAPPATAPLAAMVNGTPILLAEVDGILLRRGFSGEAPPKAMRRAVLDDLVEDLLLAQFLERQNIPVEPAELEKRWRGMAEGLRRQGKSLAEFAQQIRRTEEQIKQAWVAQIRFQKFADARTTDAALQDYHARLRDFFDRTAVRLALIAVRVPAGSPPGEWTAAREKLVAVRAEVVAGRVSFAEAAKRHSVDATAPAGGEVGWIARKDSLVDETLASAAFALPAGGVSGPVESEGGVYLLHAAERKAGTPRTFEETKDDVRECYQEEIRHTLAGQLRRTAAVQILLPQ